MTGEPVTGETVDGEPLDEPVTWRSDRPALAVVAAGTALFVLVLTAWRPWNLFDRGGFTADFYDAQARALLHLRLAVRPEEAGIEGFVVEGRTYLYYGVFLALVRLPFALVDVVTDQAVFAARLTRISMVGAYIAWSAGAHRLVHEAGRWFIGRAPSTWRITSFVALAAVTPLLALTGWVSVYHETEAWAAAFAIWGVVATLRVVRRPSRRDALIGAGAIAAALLTRASIGIGVGAAVGTIAVVSLVDSRRHRLSGRRADATLLALGSAGGLAAHMAFNTAKFSTPLGLPASQQVLSLIDPERAAWFAGNGGSFFSARFLPTTVVHYLRPDTIAFERLVPFVRFGAPAVDRGSYPMETITPAASITAAAPLLFVAAVAGAVLLAGTAVRGDRRLAWPWLALATGGAVAAVPTFTIGFVANRYLVDLLPMLMVPAAVAFAAAPLRLPRRAGRIAVVATLVWSAWVNASLGTWIAHLKSPGFTELRYRIDGALFDGAPPAVVDASVGAPVPRDGVVGVSNNGGRCSGVHVAEQGRWVALERTSGMMLRGTMSVEVPPPGSANTVVASGDTWTARWRADAGSWWVEVEHDATVTRSEPVSRTPVDQAVDTSPEQFDDTVAVEIIADPLMRLVEVTVGPARVGVFTTVAGALLAGPDVVVAAPGSEADAGPLCRLFDTRR